MMNQKVIKNLQELEKSSSLQAKKFGELVEIFSELKKNALAEKNIFKQLEGGDRR